MLTQTHVLRRGRSIPVNANSFMHYNPTERLFVIENNETYDFIEQVSPEEAIAIWEEASQPPITEKVFS